MDTDVLERAAVAVPGEPAEAAEVDGVDAAALAGAIPCRLLAQLEQLDLESGNGEVWEDLSELYAGLPESGFEAEDGGTVNLELMETHARGRNYLTALLAQREAHARRMLAEAQRRIELYRERAIGPVERARERHEQSLARLLALSGQRRVDLVHGRVEFTARRQDLQKEDDRFDAEIVAWLKAQGHTEAVQTKVEESPSMRAVKKLWKQQGVVPPHTQVVTVGGHLKITPPDPDHSS